MDTVRGYGVWNNESKKVFCSLVTSVCKKPYYFHNYIELTLGAMEYNFVEHIVPKCVHT